MQLAVQVLGVLIEGNGDGEQGRFADGASARIQSSVEPPDQIGQPDAVDIEHGGRVPICPCHRGIPRNREHVAQSGGRGAQEVALHPEHVAVPAGVVEHRFNTGFTLD
jgi:hypothetical protein